MAVRQTTSTSASPSPLRSSTLLEAAHSTTPGNAEDTYNIEKSVLLDIAFLHSIATHRPIGPHKHFNVIPVLLNLDRTARQVGARIRDDGYIRATPSGEEEAGEVSSSSTRTIKKEEIADEDDADAGLIAFASASLPLDSQLIWMRLAQLYDVVGLEELENLAIDNDSASPFRNGHTLYNRMTSIRPPLAASASTRFGFGSGLEKKKKAFTITPKSGRLNHKKAAATPVEEEDDLNEGASSEQQAEFELGPWDEYESLIAPRRFKSYASQEDGQSESEELSEPSEIEAEAIDDENQEHEDADDALSEADEAEDNAEGDEEEEVDDEEGDTSTLKRKASAKKQAASSKKAKKASSPTVKRGTRNTAKPRRSARR